MKKMIWAFLIFLAMTLLAACGDNSNESTGDSETEEPKTLDVAFDIPETAEANESVELKATVTYGDEKVKDAEEVKFEYWEKGNEDNSTMLESNNNEDGTYTAEVSFENDGVYEIYAHTTARGMHTMPKKAITVGKGTSQNTENDDENHDGGSNEHGHAEGFGMDFTPPKDVKAGKETDLAVDLQMDNEPLEGANVQYEIKSDSGNTEWVETEETKSGKYSAAYIFEDPGTYNMTIHVKNDEGLHEHDEFQIDVN
ncbi:MAG TPA: FixH family protein [Lentibacillus sp.]|uniref:FixH family protein n=1 Tax=Lentibacillus sp. TaxID=1925746 RepID=UPI002B4B504B|nr:FixH family protein [Lentibacillus sp.]HLR63631.1 FixH family protein [Lentibacillus sp.]